MPCNTAHSLSLRLVAVFRFAAVQQLEEKAKLLRKEARGVQHMVKKDEVKVQVSGWCPFPVELLLRKSAVLFWCLSCCCTVSASALYPEKGRSCAKRGELVVHPCVDLGTLNGFCVE